MARKQVPFRIDPELDKLFEQAVENCGTSKQAVLEAYVEAFVKHHTDRDIYHMNGAKCPLSAIVDALVENAAAELKQRRLPV
jgi:hypothetical protein